VKPHVPKRLVFAQVNPFGTRKRWGDQGSFLLRGVEKVRTEFRVTMLAHNLRRVLHIVGMPRLLAALGGVGRVVGTAALSEVQEALWSDRWPERHTKMGLCGNQCGWAASQRRVLTQSGAWFGAVSSNGTGVAPVRRWGLHAVHATESGAIFTVLPVAADSIIAIVTCTTCSPSCPDALGSLSCWMVWLNASTCRV